MCVCLLYFIKHKANFTIFSIVEIGSIEETYTYIYTYTLFTLFIFTLHCSTDVTFLSWPIGDAIRQLFDSIISMQFISEVATSQYDWHSVWDPSTWVDATPDPMPLWCLQNRFVFSHSGQHLRQTECQTAFAKRNFTLEMLHCYKDGGARTKCIRVFWVLQWALRNESLAHCSVAATSKMHVIRREKTNLPFECLIRIFRFSSSIRRSAILFLELIHI